MEKKIGVSLLIVWLPITKSRGKALTKLRIFMNISAIIKNYEHLSSTISKFQAATFSKIGAPFEHFFAMFEHFLAKFPAPLGYAYQEAAAATNYLLAGVRFPLSRPEEPPVFKAKCQKGR